MVPKFPKPNKYIRQGIIIRNGRIPCTVCASATVQNLNTGKSLGTKTSIDSAGVTPQTQTRNE